MIKLAAASSCTQRCIGLGNIDVLRRGCAALLQAHLPREHAALQFQDCLFGLNFSSAFRLRLVHCNDCSFNRRREASNHLAFFDEVATIDFHAMKNTRDRAAKF